jgi:hypothetical protein
MLNSTLNPWTLKGLKNKTSIIKLRECGLQELRLVESWSVHPLLLLRLRGLLQFLILECHRPYFRSAFLSVKFYTKLYQIRVSKVVFIE